MAKRKSAKKNKAAFVERRRDVSASGFERKALVAYPKKGFVISYLRNGVKLQLFDPVRPAPVVYKPASLAMPVRLEKSGKISTLALSEKSPERVKSLKTRDVFKCKERPDSRKARSGGGGSKRFVPWCS